MIKNNELQSMCVPCGGVCCQNHAGGTIPQDFKEAITIDFLVALLSTKKWTIDWWEGDPRSEISENEEPLHQMYYIRPAHTNDKEVFTGAYRGTCVFWSLEKGCAFSFDDRPFQCRGLVPKKDKYSKCEATVGSSKKDIVLSWISYQDIIEKAGTIVENKFEASNQ